MTERRFAYLLGLAFATVLVLAVLAAIGAGVVWMWKAIL